MLNQIRIGAVTPEIMEKFTFLQRPLKYSDGIEPVQMYVLPLGRKPNLPVLDPVQ